MRRRLGLELAPLVALEWRASLEGQGQVLPLDTLVELDADLSQAEEKAALSASLLARSEALHSSSARAISLAELDAFREQAAFDAADALRQERRLALAWGPQAPFLASAARTRWLARLAAGEAALLRLQLPLGAALPAGGLSFRVLPLSEGEGWKARLFWPAPADPALPGPSYLALLQGRNLPRPGEKLRVRLAGGAPLKGVLIPAAAMVVSGGEAWAYVEKDGRWLRRPLPLERPVAGGFFATDGFAPGEKVVVQGAGLLLATEMGAAQPSSKAL